MGFSDARLAKLTGLDRGARCAERRHAPRRPPGVQAHRHLRRRVRLAHAPTCTRPTRPPFAGAPADEAAPSDQQEDRSSSAAARTASARASSSTTAAATPASRCDEAGYRDHHGQLQSGDGLDRLRHLRPALFRAADRRRTCSRSSRPSVATARCTGVIVQFGGQTPLKLAQALEDAERADPRHLARRHRPRRGPRPLQAAARHAWASRQPRNGIATSPRARPRDRRRGRLSRS